MKLLEAACRLLEQYRQGFDWKWSAGEPMEDIGLDDVKLDIGEPSHQQLLEIWHFLDSFLDSRWHEIKDVDGLSWDDAVMKLKRVIEALQSMVSR